MYDRIKIWNGVIYEQGESLRIRSNIKIVRSNIFGGRLPLTVTCFEVKVGIDKRICDNLKGIKKN